jgi:hypothetical protein
MVNFKCCHNIFVIFLGKKRDRYIVGFFFSKKKKKKMLSTSGLSATWTLNLVASNRQCGSKSAWHSGHMDYGPRGRLSATWIVVHVVDCGHVDQSPSGL